MCGFVGFLSYGGLLEPDLDAWSARIAHRGPDQHGHVRRGPFGVGTRRLSIQDLSAAGDQPMEGDRFVLAFNGEIYNHHEIRARLLDQFSLNFHSDSDTETVLRAIEYWGIQGTMEQLNGMYAIAIWDKTQRRLSLIRDPLGVKPIYFLQSSDGVYFASEVKALRPYTSQRINRDAVGIYFYFGFVPAPYSLIDGIHKVRPSEHLVFDSEGRMQSDTIIPSFWANPPGLYPTNHGRLQQLRDAVSSAVKRQLLSDVPVGIFLSGGIDSTIIAGVAARENPGMSSFSLRPGATEHNPDASTDARLAGELAQSLGLDHHEVPFSPEDLLTRLDDCIETIDEPVAEIYALAEQILSQQARNSGVNVVLTGHGGDEVFLGYPTYAAVSRGDFYNRIPLFGQTARLAARSTLLPVETRVNLLGAASVWRQTPMQRYRTVSGVHFSLEDAAAEAGIPENHLDTIVQRIFDDTIARVALLPNGTGSTNAELFARMDLLLMVPEHYNTRLDRMTMSASIEARVPFQDLELIGTVAQLGHGDLMNGGLKGMLRTAFESELPESVRNRTKQTFQAPMASWVNGHMEAWINAKLPARYASSPQAVSAGPVAPSRQAYQTWSLAILEGWRIALGLEY